MSDTQSNIIGYGLLSALSVILFQPIAEYLNANMPADSIGDALGSFFWIAYSVLILFLLYKTMVSVLYG